MSGETDDLHRYLRMLAGINPAGRLIEIRSATPDGGMRQTFTAATSPDLAARAITTLGASTDVYIGVVLRRRRAGGRDACERSHLAFIEIDASDAVERLARYRCPPTAVVLSGSPGHAHAYWQLHQPVEHDVLEQANRRLAIRLGGDLASVDAARILRPPTSWNRKRTPPSRVELHSLSPARRYTLAELTDSLSDPPPSPRACDRRRTGSNELDRQLLAIPAATYVPALTGRHPDRAGKVQCPFHDDHTPSLQLYQHDWYCYGACRTGGSIYDFAALLYSLRPRGREFIQLRQRLADDLRLRGPAAVPASARTRHAHTSRARAR